MKLPVAKGIIYGIVYSTVDQNSYNMSWLLAAALHRAVTYSSYQRQTITVEFSVITRENVLDYFPEVEDIYVAP